MKLFTFKKYPVLVLVCCLYGCKSNDDTIIDSNPDPVIVELSENIVVYDDKLLENSLVLAVENGGDKSYLLDKRGNKIFEWNFNANLGNDFEILPDGKALGIFKVEEPAFSFGGFGGSIRILNQDGSVDWEYVYASDTLLAHHDVEILPNGNVLFLAWEKIDATTAQENGVDFDSSIYPEKLIEVNPDTNEIVWEWSSWDHIVQDKYNTLPNYGVIKDNPQLININYSLPDDGDIMHANGIDYDAVNDLVFISVNFFSEVWVIDHSTSTNEAAGHSSGAFNKGGDLIYRFGNPEAYNNPKGNRLFYNNHFPNILIDNQPGAGNVLIYVNKGLDIEQSTVYELKLPTAFDLLPETDNEPEVVWSFTDPDLFNPKISGAIRLRNGNTLICEGDYGFWEVTNKGDVVWKYDGSSGSAIWRGYSYALDSPEILSLGL
jgi:hypothetical protein